MAIKRIMVAAFIIFAYTIAIWLALGIYYKTANPLNWPPFMQGIFTAVNIFGIAGGVRMVIALFARPKVKDRHAYR